MILGLIFLCQPWVEVLHRYGLTIILHRSGRLHRSPRMSRRSLRPTTRKRTNSSDGPHRAEKLQKFFGSVQVLKDVNLTIEDGEFVVMLGQSGCGKTTTLRAIAGLETVTSGTISIDGREVQDLQARPTATSPSSSSPSRSTRT